MAHSSSSRDHQRKPWQDIAERVTHEHDPEKVIELTHELLDALDEEKKQGRLEPKSVDEASKTA